MRFMFVMWQCKLYNAIWAFGFHFRVERIDNKRRTHDCGVIASFQQESQSSARDRNPISGDIEYVGTIQNIYDVSFGESGHYFLFDVKWFKVVCRGPNATVKSDPSGFFAIDSSKTLSMESFDTLVLPRHCEQVHMLCYNVFHFIASDFSI